MPDEAPPGHTPLRFDVKPASRADGAGRTPASWLAEFLRLEAAGGLVLIATAALAMLVANSPLANVYATALSLPFEVRLGILGGSIVVGLLGYVVLRVSLRPSVYSSARRVDALRGPA